MIKTLVLTKKFSKNGSNPWLFDDFVENLCLRGHKVVVALADASGEWERGVVHLDKNIIVISYPIRGRNKIRKAVSIITANFWLLYKVFRANEGNFDYMFSSSIASLFLPFIFLFSAMRKVKCRILFLWDFFPIHHLEIGHLYVKNKMVRNFLYFIEKKAINCYDAVGLMSEENVNFFKNYHSHYKGKVIIHPLWGKDRNAIVSGSIKPVSNDELHVVFGGQLANGRGVENIIKVAELIKNKNEKIRIHIYGDGPLAFKIKDEADSPDSSVIIYHGSKPRELYLQEIMAFDVGLVITVANVSVPTFPSKIIDYFVSSMPVLACVESSTDFGTVIQDKAEAGMYVHVESINSIYGSLLKFKELKLKGELIVMGENGRQYFLKNMEVGVVLDKLFTELGKINKGYANA